MKLGSSPSPTRKHSQFKVEENDIDLDILPSARIEHNNVDGGLNFNSIDEEQIVE
jgi:hypothetical protein